MNNPDRTFRSKRQPVPAVVFDDGMQSAARPKSGPKVQCPVCGEQGLRDSADSDKVWHVRKYAPCVRRKKGMADGDD